MRKIYILSLIIWILFNASILSQINSIKPYVNQVTYALETTEITWSSENIVGGITIKLSTDGGATYPFVLIENTPNDGSEPVTLPDINTRFCKVKIESYDNPTLFDETKGNFVITGRDLFTLKYYFPKGANKTAIGDINQDGITDLAVGYSTEDNSYVTIYSFNSTTQMFDSLQSIAYGYPQRIYPLIGDADSDGNNELIVTTDNGDAGGYVKIYRYSGSNVWTEVWSNMFITVRREHGVNIGEVDNDGQNEISIGVTWGVWWGQKSVHILEYMGNDNWQSSVALTGNDINTTFISDCDNDGLKDLLVGTGNWDWYDWRIYKWNGSTYFLNTFSQPLGLVGAISGDTDNDGLNEIVTSSEINNYYGGGPVGENNLKIFKWDGVSYTNEWSWNSGYSTTNPAIGNLSGNKNQIAAFSGSWAATVQADSRLHIFEKSVDSYQQIWQSDLFSDQYNGDCTIGNVDNVQGNELVFTHNVDGVFIYGSENISQSNPVLSWTGEVGFELDGVNPNEGSTSSIFTFRVKYSDADGDAPQSWFPKVHIKKSGVEITSSPFTMSEVNTDPFTTGRIYTFDINTLIAGNDYSYYFDAFDANGTPAIGEATIEQVAPIVSQALFSETSIFLPAIYNSSVAWGDYDNDDELDILLTGNGISNIYENLGNDIFTEALVSTLYPTYNASSAWGDYDNDGDLDLIINGLVYKNESPNIYIPIANLSNMAIGSIAWGDYDNDGDLDILLAGNDAALGTITKIFKNDGNDNFIDQTTLNLVGVENCSVAWGDYNNDDNLDFVISGYKGGGFIGENYVTIIYRNNGNNTFTEQTSIILDGVRRSSVAWGDYDNDSYLDILLSGATETDFITKIYHNNGNGSFNYVNTATLVGVSRGSVAWGDYNNDGYLDVLVAGFTTQAVRVTKIYKNNLDNTFSEQSQVFPGVYFGSLAWGDYDNDGDLDILLTGELGGNNGVSKVFKNNNQIPNTLPSSPTNLTSTVNGQTVTFNWNKSTDAETPQNGLTYNLVVSTTPGGVDIVSPMSDRTTGYRRVINMGNTNHNNSWIIKGLEPGTYYWSVQAIDNAFAGSAFAEEHSFTIAAPLTNHFNPIWTGNPYVPMNIYITSATIDGADLISADEIGVFDGENCVGSIVLSNPIPPAGFISILAATDDPTTTEVDGFVPGHTITYRLWENGNSREITRVNPTYTLGDGTFSSQGSALLSLAGIYTITQNVALNSGWNILSLATTPDNPNMLQLLNPLITAGTLIKVQDERGFAVEQLPVIGWINNIGDWLATEGYYMRVNGSSILNVEGVPVALPLSIPLTNGWNIIGYPVLTEQNALTVLNPLISANQLIKVQNEAGQAIEQLPVIGWINNIGNFKSGEGYYLKVNTNTSLTLTDPGDTPVKLLAVNEEEVKQKNISLNKPNADHFVPIYSSPYLPMNIYVTAVSLSGGGTLAAGDEIGIFDGNNCVGSITLTGPIGSFVSIIASTDDPSASGTDGFTPGHTISYRFWLSSTLTEITTYNVEYTVGDGTFASQGTAVVSFESVLPVELTSFTANVNKAQVDLNWQTATEINNYGFEIERKTESDWKNIGFVNGNGNSNSPKQYSFTDNSLIGGNKFQYRLKQIDNDGQFEYSDIVEVEVAPNEYVLYQNYPNPFNPVSKVRFAIPVSGRVSMKLYNAVGEEVMEIINQDYGAGHYEVEINSSNLASGIYFYKIVTNNFTAVKKLIIMK